MDELEWGDPPRHEGRTYHRHQQIAKSLRDRKGEWAHVTYNSARAATHAASKANRGGILAYTPAGDFEAVYRQIDGEYRMYIRFLGDGPDE